MMEWLVDRRPGTRQERVHLSVAAVAGLVHCGAMRTVLPFFRLVSLLAVSACATQAVQGVDERNPSSGQASSVHRPEPVKVKAASVPLKPGEYVGRYGYRSQRLVVGDGEVRLYIPKPDGYGTRMAGPFAMKVAAADGPWIALKGAEEDGWPLMAELLVAADGAMWLDTVTAFDSSLGPQRLWATREVEPSLFGVWKSVTEGVSEPSLEFRLSKQGFTEGAGDPDEERARPLSLVEVAGGLRIFDPNDRKEIFIAADGDSLKFGCRAFGQEGGGLPMLTMTRTGKPLTSTGAARMSGTRNLVVVRPKGLAFRLRIDGQTARLSELEAEGKTLATYQVKATGTTLELQSTDRPGRDRDIPSNARVVRFGPYELFAALDERMKVTAVFWGFKESAPPAELRGHWNATPLGAHGNALLVPRAELDVSDKPTWRIGSTQRAVIFVESAEGTERLLLIREGREVRPAALHPTGAGWVVEDLASNSHGRFEPALFLYREVPSWTVATRLRAELMEFCDEARMRRDLKAFGISTSDADLRLKLSAKGFREKSQTSPRFLAAETLRLLDWIPGLIPKMRLGYVQERLQAYGIEPFECPVIEQAGKEPSGGGDQTE